MPVVARLASALVLAGALNWGLIGLFAFDLVAELLGAMTLPSRIIYTLVGAAAMWQLLPLFGSGEEDRRVAPN